MALLNPSFVFFVTIAEKKSAHNINVFFLCLGTLSLIALRSSQPANSCHLSVCVTTAPYVTPVKSSTESKSIYFHTGTANQFLLFFVLASIAECLCSLKGVFFCPGLTISKKTWQASMVFSSSHTWSCYRTYDNKDDKLHLCVIFEHELMFSYLEFHNIYKGKIVQSQVLQNL